MAHYRSSSCLALLATLLLLLWMSVPVLAQLYDPGEQIFNDGQVRVFIDPKGQRVTMDRHGRIIAVEPVYEQPQIRGRRGYRGGGNWTLNGPVDGGVPYDGFDDVPEDPNYYPAAPSAPEYDYNRDGQIERSELPPVGSEHYDQASIPDYQPQNRSLQQGQPRGYPDINDMTPAVEMPKGSGAKAKIAAYQVLLDRAGASPGVIDGRFGSNVDKAAAAYSELTGRFINPQDEAAIQAELEATGGAPFKEYMITEQDAAQNLVAAIPADYAEKAKLSSMAYTSHAEMLGERFHIDEAYLKEINPGANFGQPGTIIKVPNIKRAKKPKVARIIADKARKQVRGYDENGKLVVAYPSTIGSSDNPSPSGIVQVERIAVNPNYTYNPKINFKQGNNNKVLVIPPGPNGPVGTVWIALSKPTYGIHGTPEPSRIGKTSSHGCVRLTNWDAQELAKLVGLGVTVEFIE